MSKLKRMYVEPAAGAGIVEATPSSIGGRRPYQAVCRSPAGDGQPEAVRLYESAGYRRIDPLGVYVGSPPGRCFEKRTT